MARHDGGASAPRDRSGSRGSPFISPGDRIRVNTENGEYIERVL
ncbi:hypothetical protein [Ktedonobacter racemifer]